MKVNPEFLPVIEWWEKDGKQFVTYLAIAAVAVGAYYGWKAHRASARVAAAQAVANAYTTDELEDAVAKFGGSAAGEPLKLRLAKSYFDAGRYDAALEQYEALDGKVSAAFADIPVVGKAQCLEALGRFDEAAKAFDDYSESHPDSYLKLTAQLGAARAIAQAGDKTKALARLDALKAANQDDKLATARIESTEDAVKRYVKPAAPAPAVVESKQPEAKPAETKPEAAK